MKKLTRSNSHDNVSLNPFSTIIHSKPTSHGAGRRSFAAKDDASSTSSSSSNQHIAPSSPHIVPSPYQSASSALAVLDILPLNFGAIRLCLPDRPQISAISIPDQQPTVAYTKDLPLPIDLLPGEDDVKLQEDLTYRSSDGKMIYHGELIVTKYRLLFVTKSPDPIQVLVNTPIGMISQIDKIGGRTRSKRSDGALYGIEIICKDLRHYFFGNAKEQHQRRTLIEQLTPLIFPFSISEAHITNPLQFFSSFFAWNYKKTICPNTIDEGWRIYNKIKDYTRMGIKQSNDPYWTINTEINKNYALCDTYPDVLVLPSSFDTSRLQNVAAFRSRNRIPVLSWYSHETSATITRASQPLTGLNRKSQDDVDYLHEITNTNVNEDSKLIILDARPKMNALVNELNGGGYEKNYPNCELEFQDIENIHVMRESLHKLHSAIRLASLDNKTWLDDLENSKWLFHIRAILTSTNRLVSFISHDKRSVFVHCSDGWDRTAQFTSLSMLMLDSYYRTLNGFMILVEKEWISFGHKFSLRLGHGNKNQSESSPVFLQFLDCTYQLTQQFPSAFEFNEKFLLTIADCLYSCQYGTFLLNSEKNRIDMKISEYTMSVWTPILRDRRNYINPLYNEKLTEILQTNISANQIKLWKNYYCRYIPDYQSTSDLLIHRNSTLSNLRNKFTNGINHIRHEEDSSQQ